MRINITARHLKLTPAIRAYVEEKAARAQRYFNNIVWAQVVLAVEKRTHQAEIVIHAPKQTFRAMASGMDLYAAVDLASDKMDTQLKKHKERLRNHHRIQEAPSPGKGFFDAAEAVQFSVVKQVPMKPMTREQAVSEMDSLGFSFWMFQDKEAGQVQVIYRRLDDTYGLLQPVKWSGK